MQFTEFSKTAIVFRTCEHTINDSTLFCPLNWMRNIQVRIHFGPINHFHKLKHCVCDLSHHPPYNRSARVDPETCFSLNKRCDEHLRPVRSPAVQPGATRAPAYRQPTRVEARDESLFLCLSRIQRLCKVSSLAWWK